jgi:hypothetical protein
VLKKKILNVFNFISAFILLVVVNFGMFVVMVYSDVGYDTKGFFKLGLFSFIYLYVVYACVYSVYVLVKDGFNLRRMLVLKDSVDIHGYVRSQVNVAYNSYIYSVFVVALAFLLGTILFTGIYLIYLKGFMPVIVYSICVILLFIPSIISVVKLYFYARRF